MMGISERPSALAEAKNFVDSPKNYGTLRAVPTTVFKTT
jgi:hypothetical protein